MLVVITAKVVEKIIDKTRNDSEGLTIRCRYDKRLGKINGQGMSIWNQYIKYKEEYHITRECLDSQRKNKGKESNDGNASFVSESYESVDIVILIDNTNSHDWISLILIAPFVWVLTKVSSNLLLKLKVGELSWIII